MCYNYLTKKAHIKLFETVNKEYRKYTLVWKNYALPPIPQHPRATNAKLNLKLFALENWEQKKTDFHGGKGGKTKNKYKNEKRLSI